MPQKFAPTKLLLSQSWLSAEDLTEEIISPLAKAALQVRGLLTLALQEAYGKPVSVECLRMSEWADEHEVLGLRRDVILKAGHTHCVTASTLIPANVLKSHPWLAGMGNNPLGETLESRVTHHRGPFEFSQVDLGQIFRLNAPTPQFTWARRYRFFLEGGALLVTEIFLPGVLDRLGS